MTGVVVCRDPQGSGGWHRARRQGVTGTDIGVLLGLSRWRTPLDVWLWRTPLDVWLSKRDDHTPDEPSEPMRWGQRLEPVVRDHYAEQHPDAVVEEVPGMLGHQHEPILRGSLDGLAHDRDGTVVLEVKTTRQSWASDYLPDGYLAQALWYLGITGLDVCHVALLAAGQSYSERVVATDPRWFDAAADYALGWWDRHVVAGVMPDPDPVRDAPSLPRLWTPDPAASVELDAGLVAGLRDARARAAAAKTEADELAARVQVAMGAATTGTVDGEVAVRWSGVKPRTTVDVAALKADGLFDKYSRRGDPSRRFTVTNQGEMP